MGFSIRKSVRVGPLRFNLSSSGVGVSSGIPGIRVSVGPRGTYIRMGGDGFYYRQTVAPKPGSQNASDQGKPSERGYEERTHGPMIEVGSGCVTQMVDTNSAALLAEIKIKQSRILLWPIALFLSVVAMFVLAASGIPAWATVVCCLFLIAALVVVYQTDQLKKCVVLMYDLRGESLQAFQGLFSAMHQVSKCGGSWRIDAQGNVYDPKYHAGAGTLVSRQPLNLHYADPPYVKTNIPVPSVAFGKASMYFLPDRVLMYASSGIGAVDYDSLIMSSRLTRFIEDGAVPFDAEVVDYTWRYVNKSGGPDRRFNNNFQLPICQYEELLISSANGVNEIVQLSRVGVSSQLESAITSMVEGIRSARAAEEQRLKAEKQARGSLATQGTTRSSTCFDPIPSRCHNALFELLCCVMVSDGRASSSEKDAIADIMSQLSDEWPHELTAERIGAFIKEIQDSAYSKVVRRSISRIEIFRESRCGGKLLEHLNQVAQADGKLSNKELEFCEAVRKSLDSSVN